MTRKKAGLLLVGLLVLLTGLLAGQMFHEQIGAQEALQPLADRTYVEYWQSLDKLMHVRMPIVSNLMLLVFIATLLVLRRQWRSWAYGLLLGAFALALAETVVTVTLQLPVNHAIQLLDPAHLPVDVSPYKVATAAHFRIRAVLRLLMFAGVIVAAMRFSRAAAGSLLS